MPKDRPRERDLLVDVYRPVAGGKPLANRPAVIMAFGGAFHRGHQGEEHFPEDGAQGSSMAHYSPRFARDGFACLSIAHPLPPSHPGLHTPVHEYNPHPPTGKLSPAAP